MQKIRVSRQILMLALLLALGTVGAIRAEEERSGWDQAEQEVKEAGSEVKEAAGAVKEATRETSKDVWQKVREGSQKIYTRSKELWDTTRESTGETLGTVQEESRRTWDKVKEGSREAVENTRARIHEATAPAPAPPKETVVPKEPVPE